MTNRLLVLATIWCNHFQAHECARSEAQQQLENAKEQFTRSDWTREDLIQQLEVLKARVAGDEIQILNLHDKVISPF